MPVAFSREGKVCARGQGLQNACYVVARGFSQPAAMGMRQQWERPSPREKGERVLLRTPEEMQIRVEADRRAQVHVGGRPSLTQPVLGTAAP